MNQFPENGTPPNLLSDYECKCLTWWLVSTRDRPKVLGRDRACGRYISQYLRSDPGFVWEVSEDSTSGNNYRRLL